MERSLPPSISGTEFGPRYASFVVPPNSTPAKPVPPTFPTTDGPPTRLKFPSAARFVHVADPAELSDARRSTYNVPAICTCACAEYSESESPTPAADRFRIWFQCKPRRTALLTEGCFRNPTVQHPKLQIRTPKQF